MSDRLTIEQIIEGLRSERECYESPPDSWFREAVDVLLDAVKEKPARDKKMCTDFFYWWYNASGTNTMQGYDEWREKHWKENTDA